MIKAYETEGHGIYWQVFIWELGQEEDRFIGDMESLDGVMAFARVQQMPITLYTQEWYEKLQQEGEEE
jgi:hypothetical protein